MIYNGLLLALGAAALYVICGSALIAYRAYEDDDYELVALALVAGAVWVLTGYSATTEVL